MDFIQDNTTVMIHSYSRVVMMLLLKAAALNRRFRVLVTEARPTSRGYQAAQNLRKNGIPTTVILDAAVGHYIEKVDMVLVGAEGVVENGGIINQVRGPQAMLAHGRVRLDRNLLDSGHGQGSRHSVLCRRRKL